MIRCYHSSDKLKVLQLLNLNTPDYFHQSEAKDYLYYLDNELEDYYVYEVDGHLLGAGGINYFPTEQQARLSWDLIHPQWHKKGIGTKLTQYRIRHLTQQSQVKELIVRTSQFALAFYEQMGFTTIRFEADYWAKGFHLYQMSLSL